MNARSDGRCITTAFRAALIAAAAAAVAACTSSGTGRVAQTLTSDPSPTQPVTTSAAPSETATSAPASPSTPPTSASHTSSATTSASTGPKRSTCTSISVRVLPGGAEHGQEIAGLQFTNTGTRRCTLYGYPTATLLRDGQQIGQPSQPSTTAPSSRTLAPGEVAESLLHNYTQTCQAPLSDAIRVRVPGTTMSVIRPLPSYMQLRACILRVDKLSAPD